MKKCYLRTPKDEPENPFKGIFDELQPRPTPEQMREALRKEVEFIKQAGGWAFEDHNGNITYGTKDEMINLRRETERLRREVHTI